MLATNEAGKVPHPLELCFPDNARVWSLASLAGPSDWVNGGQDKELGSHMHAGRQGTQSWPGDGAVRSSEPPSCCSCSLDRCGGRGGPGRGRDMREGLGRCFLILGVSSQNLRGQGWSPSSCLVFLVFDFSVDRYRWTSPAGPHLHSITESPGSL